MHCLHTFLSVIPPVVVLKGSSVVILCLKKRSSLNTTSSEEFVHYLKTNNVSWDLSKSDWIHQEFLDTVKNYHEDIIRRAYLVNECYENVWKKVTLIDVRNLKYMICTTAIWSIRWSRLISVVFVLFLESDSVSLLHDPSFFIINEKSIYWDVADLLQKKINGIGWVRQRSLIYFSCANCLRIFKWGHVFLYEVEEI